ncbi:MAG TPA: hypothetical protein VIX84_19390, partial [Acidimicrobiales bacterium]
SHFAAGGGMSFLGLMLRAGLRHRWRSWLALALLTALALGLVLAGAQTARRTATAFSRYKAAHGYDAVTYSAEPAQHLAALAKFGTTTTVVYVGSAPPACDGCDAINTNNFGVNEAPPRSLGRLVKLVAGRMPNESDASEVLASYNLVPFGIHVGSVLHLPLVASSQRPAVLGNQNLTPHGPVATVHVVGLEVSEFEFPGAQTPSYDIYTTAAFARAYNSKTVTLYEYFFNLRHGQAAVPEFEAIVPQHGLQGVVDMDAEGNTIATSIAPQAVGWWILTGLAALVGIVVLVQALARQAALEAEDFPALAPSAPGGDSCSPSRWRARWPSPSSVQPAPSLWPFCCRSSRPSARRGWPTRTRASTSTRCSSWAPSWASPSCSRWARGPRSRRRGGDRSATRAPRCVPPAPSPS